jgi:hypothetical protein
MKITQLTIADLYMKRNKVKILLYALILILVGCESREISADDYGTYWKKYQKQLSDTKQIGTYNMTMTYIPMDLLILNDNQGVLTQQTYHKSKIGFCDHYYFTIDIEDNKEKEVTKKYFTRDRQTQFSMIMAQDTLPCVLYQPEMTGLTNRLKINVVFQRPQEGSCDKPVSKDIEIAYMDYRDSTRHKNIFTINKEKINQLKKIRL